jgi:hypothetical protein
LEQAQIQRTGTGTGKGKGNRFRSGGYGLVGWWVGGLPPTSYGVQLLQQPIHPSMGHGQHRQPSHLMQLTRDHDATVQGRPQGSATRRKTPETSSETGRKRRSCFFSLSSGNLGSLCKPVTFQSPGRRWRLPGCPFQLPVQRKKGSNPSHNWAGKPLTELSP